MGLMGRKYGGGMGVMGGVASYDDGQKAALRCFLSHVFSVRQRAKKLRTRSPSEPLLPSFFFAARTW